MTVMFSYPDVSPADIKEIELKYYSKDSEYLVKKAAKVIADNIKKITKKNAKIIFVCGKGNNGLDGIYASKLLSDLNFDINIFLTEANHHQSEINILSLENKICTNVCFEKYDIVVDCIFGYGINKPLSLEVQSLVDKINKAEVIVISIDIPSGLHPQTGNKCPVSISCDYLITFINIKRGLFTNLGRDTWKNIYFDPLIQEDIESCNYLISANNMYKFTNTNTAFKDLKGLSYSHKNSSHKKSDGVNLIIAGEPPYHGSMILSTLACLKTGCRYLNVLTHEEYSHSLPYFLPEVITAPHLLEFFSNNIGNYKNILIGPGMNSEIVPKYLELIINNLDTIKSVVIDAGAIHALKGFKFNSNKIIITPHPGEAAAILDCSVSDIQANRYEAAKNIFHKLGCRVILKGSGTIIFDGKSYYTCMDGNHRMGVAGMGDVLSGILLSELSRQKDLSQACIKAVIFHSYSADFLFINQNILNYLPSMIPDTYSKLTK